MCTPERGNEKNGKDNTIYHGMPIDVGLPFTNDGKTFQTGTAPENFNDGKVEKK